MKVNRVIVIASITLILLLAAGAVIIMRPDSSDISSAASLYIPDETGVAVEAARAVRGRVIPEIKSSGLIRGRNEALIISETRGVIVQVYKTIGSTVLPNGNEPVFEISGLLRRSDAVERLQLIEKKFILLKLGLEYDNSLLERETQRLDAGLTSMLSVETIKLDKKEREYQIRQLSDEKVLAVLELYNIAGIGLKTLF